MDFYQKSLTCAQKQLNLDIQVNNLTVFNQKKQTYASFLILIGEAATP